MISEYCCKTCNKKTPCTSGIHVNCKVYGYCLSISQMEFIEILGCASHSDFQNQREKMLDELQTIKEYDRIRFHQKHTLPKSWVEVKVTSVSKDGKRIGISGKMPGEGCTTEMGIDLSDVRQVCRWIELNQEVKL